MHNSMKIQPAILVVSVFLWALAAPSVFAAAIVFEADTGSSAPLGTFTVGAYLDTEGESINAIEGKIFFPAEMLTAEEVRAGNSLVPLWLEAPRAESGAIPFTGLIPAGIAGKKLFLFSVVFRGQSTGIALLASDLSKVLRNDGTGDEVPVRQTPFSVAVVPSALGSPAVSGYKEDVLPPDIFRPVFGVDEGLFGGSHFLAFVAQDKGSSVSYYEVREEGYAPVRAISPYLLQNQKLDKKVIVTAFDMNGNMRVAVAYPPEWRPWYRRYAAVLAAIALLGIVTFMRMRSSFFRSS